MPSSMIFTGLVVLWLIVLVPAVARHRQEVSRPTAAALSSRVLVRPQRCRSVEVENVHERDTGVLDDAQDAPIPAARDGRSPVAADRRAGDAADEDAGFHDQADDVTGDDDPYDDRPDPTDPDDRGWERPPPRYRPGRGGFDAEAAALTARARYAFRQRVVLALLVTAVASAVAAIVVSPLVWGLHGVIDAALVGYLAYLRRQVRMEEQIRARRAARLAGTRRAPAADDPELDEWAERGRAAMQAETVDEEADGELADADDADVDAFEDEPERVSGTGEPVGLLRVHATDVDTPALPRLQPAPPPPLPAGTALVEADDADLAVTEIELPHRRAVGE